MPQINVPQVLMGLGAGLNPALAPAFTQLQQQKLDAQRQQSTHDLALSRILLEVMKNPDIPDSVRGNLEKRFSELSGIKANLGLNQAAQAQRRRTAVEEERETAEFETGQALAQSRIAKNIAQTQKALTPDQPELSAKERMIEDFAMLELERLSGQPLTRKKELKLQILRDQVDPPSLGRLVTRIAFKVFRDGPKSLSSNEQAVLQLARNLDPLAQFQLFGGLLGELGGAQQAGPDIILPDFVNEGGIVPGGEERMRQHLQSGDIHPDELRQGLMEMMSRNPGKRGIYQEFGRNLGIIF